MGSQSELVRGRLAVKEIEGIISLAENRLKPGQIALKLNRHRATINQAMVRMGLRACRERTFAYNRAGRPVRSFTPDEDCLMEVLRMQGFSIETIARTLSKRFGHPRVATSVAYRLKVLACRSEAEF